MSTITSPWISGLSDKSRLPAYPSKSSFVDAFASPSIFPEMPAEISAPDAPYNFVIRWIVGPTDASPEIETVLHTNPSELESIFFISFTFPVLLLYWKPSVVSAVSSYDVSIFPSRFISAPASISNWLVTTIGTPATANSICGNFFFNRFFSNSFE